MTREEKALMELYFYFIIKEIDNVTLRKIYRILENDFVSYDNLVIYEEFIRNRKFSVDDFKILSKHAKVNKKHFALMCDVARQTLYKEPSKRHVVKLALREGHEEIYLFFKLATATFANLYLNFADIKYDIFPNRELSRSEIEGILEYNFYTLLELFNFSFISSRHKEHPIGKFQQVKNLLTVVDLPSREPLLKIYRNIKLNEVLRPPAVALSTALAICNRDEEFLFQRLEYVYKRSHKTLSNAWWKYLKEEFMIHGSYREEAEIIKNFLRYVEENFRLAGRFFYRIKDEFWHEIKERL